MKITSISLPDDLTSRIDDVARSTERSRSFVIRKMLETALTAQERAAALDQIAAAGLTDDSADATLDAFEKMAKAATRK